jgi:hypothetical protein
VALHAAERRSGETNDAGAREELAAPAMKRKPRKLLLGLRARMRNV